MSGANAASAGSSKEELKDWYAHEKKAREEEWRGAARGSDSERASMNETERIEEPEIDGRGPMIVLRVKAGEQELQKHD